MHTPKDSTLGSPPSIPVPTYGRTWRTLVWALLLSWGPQALADSPESDIASGARGRIENQENGIGVRLDGSALCNAAGSVRDRGANAKESGYVPCGYRSAFSEDFTTFLVAANPGDQARWSSMFTRWNTRNLAGNGDEAVKVADDTKLPSGRTVREAMRSSAAWGDRQNYVIESSHGTLKLRAYPLADDLRREFWGYPYVASMISAEQAPGLRYGYWEFKAKINAIGAGQHLAFWLLADDGSWPPEVDILEVVGTNRRQFTANVHSIAKAESRPMTFYDEPPSANGFHVFGFEWTPSIMRWTVDGRLIREQANCIGDKPMHFLVSWEIGSRWPGQPDASTPWPAEVELGYVRAYRWGG